MSNRVHIVGVSGGIAGYVPAETVHESFILDAARVKEERDGLLAACEAVVEEAAGCFHDEADFSDEWKILMAQLRAAIAKAHRLHAEQQSGGAS